MGMYGVMSTENFTVNTVIQGRTNTYGVYGRYELKKYI